MKFIVKLFSLFVCFIIFSCSEKISDTDLETYKELMDVRLGHLGNAIIIQGRLLDAFNLQNERADEDHFKEAEELIQFNLKKFGRPDQLSELKIPNSSKLRNIHRSLIETSELMISLTNTLEDNAWLGGSVTYAEKNLETARVNFQKAVKVIYKISSEKEIKPEMEYEEYDVGEKPDEKIKLEDGSIEVVK